MKQYAIKIGKTLLAMIVTATAAAALLYGVWRWLAMAEPGILAAYALVITIIAPAALLFGYWLGKTEARGVIAGIDRGIDKLSDAVGLRDNSVTAQAVKVNHWQRAGRQEDRQQIIVQLPAGNQLPMISHRQSENSDILDL